MFLFFFSSRRRHTRFDCDWSSDVCSSDLNLAIIDKRRARPNEVAEMQIIGEVDGRVAVIVDDMVDTAGTLSAAAEAGRGAGAPPGVARAAPPGRFRPALPRLPPSRIHQVNLTHTN